MSQQLYTNNAISLLETNLNTSSLTIEVIPGDGQLFPQPVNPGDYFLITLEDEHNTIREIVKCIGRTGDIIQIAPDGRGFENTVIRNWPENTLVDHRITAHTLSKIEQVKGNVSSPEDNNVVLSSQSKNIDISPITYPYNVSCKWIITVVDEANNKVSVIEVLAAHRGILDPAYTIFAKTGDSIHYNINISSDANNLILTVQNTSSSNLRINSIRLNY